MTDLASREARETIAWLRDELRKSLARNSVLEAELSVVKKALEEALKVQPWQD